jgi:hypothetical protein
MSFFIPPQSAIELQATLLRIVETIKALTAAKTASSGRSPAHAAIEYQYTGEVFLEVFCNPNIWSSPFAAKVLLTVRDDRLRLSAEAELSRLIDDVNQYIEQIS